MAEQHTITNHQTGETLYTGTQPECVAECRRRWSKGQGDVGGRVYVGPRIVARVAPVGEVLE